GAIATATATTAAAVPIRPRVSLIIATPPDRAKVQMPHFGLRAASDEVKGVGSMRDREAGLPFEGSPGPPCGVCRCIVGTLGELEQDPHRVRGGPDALIREGELAQALVPGCVARTHCRFPIAVRPWVDVRVEQSLGAVAGPVAKAADLV